MFMSSIVKLNKTEDDNLDDDNDESVNLDTCQIAGRVTISRSILAK
jgi:hypothetical protein